MTRKEAAVVAVAVVLRVALALVNREANDDHLPVIAILADEGRAPGLTEMWEGFQPKLYHATVAIVWRVLELQGPTSRIVAAQLVSAAAGCVTVILLAAFLATRGLAPRARLFTLAVVALNPGVLTIGAHATNDALVTALGALAVLAAARFLTTDSAPTLAATTAAAAAATLAKGNGVALPFAVVATLALDGAGRLRGGLAWPHRRRAFVQAGAVATACVAIAALGGPYVELTRRFGSPFANPALVEAPWPALVERSAHMRPGVRSVSEALLTFPLAEMLRRPTTSNEDAVRDVHRTSLWAQLYGRATFSRFAAHPRSWATETPVVLGLGRLLLVLGLVPAALLALGMVRALVALVARVSRRVPPADGDGRVRTEVFLALLAWGQLAMIALYALRFRDFSGMKDIFLHPALLAYAALLAREIDRVERAHTRWPAALLGAALGALVVLDVIDVGLLLAQLATRATW